MLKGIPRPERAQLSINSYGKIREVFSSLSPRNTARQKDSLYTVSTLSLEISRFMEGELFRYRTKTCIIFAPAATTLLTIK